MKKSGKITREAKSNPWKISRKTLLTKKHKQNGQNFEKSNPWKKDLIRETFRKCFSRVTFFHGAKKNTTAKHQNQLAVIRS